MKYMYMCSYLYTHNICNQVFCTDTKKVNTPSHTDKVITQETQRETQEAAPN